MCRSLVSKRFVTHGSLPSQQRSKQPTFTQLECMQFLMHTKTCILHTRCIHAHARSFLLIKNAQSGSFCSFSLFQKKLSGFPLKVRYIHSLDRDTKVSLQADDDVQGVKETIKAAGRKALQRFFSQLGAEVSQTGENDKPGGVA